MDKALQIQPQKLQVLPKLSATSAFFPCIDSLPRRNGEGTIRFEISGRFGVPRPARELYLARAVDGNNLIIVKFSRSYGIELHEHCFKEGRAPEVLGYDILAGGWHAIAMEYIDAGSLANSKPDSFVNLKKGLGDLVSGFHGKGFVYGDLRDANILIRDDKFWLVDFDWAGKVGQAHYPTVHLNDELKQALAEAPLEDLRIQKSHDQVVLNITLGKLI